MKRQLTLDNIISRRICTDAAGWQDWDGTLNEAQRNGLMALLGSGCRQATKARLQHCVNDNCRRVKPCGIIGRVHLEQDGASYCAGQDYPSEIRTVRRIMIASY
jgi:hypothetical protein